jgi:hypothetical protein
MVDEAGRRKIGHSNKPSRRRMEIAGRRKLLRVVHTSVYSPVANKIEKTAHRLLKLAGKHVEYEWFSASLDECIEAIARAERIVAGLEPDLPPASRAVSFRLDDAKYEELQALAKADHHKLGTYVVMVLKDHLAAAKQGEFQTKSKSRKQ